MEQISVRDLRQNASRWLRRVHEGESFEVTDRGQPVAILAPLPPASELDRLIATGRARPAQGSLLDQDPPLSPISGVLLPSDLLTQMRADEQ